MVLKSNSRNLDPVIGRHYKNRESRVRCSIENLAAIVFFMSSSCLL